jgi:uncharacterized protein (DUF952 family)
VIYKLLPAAEWAVAVAQGSYPGSAVELRWEVSRGGARFPHLYGELPVAAVVAAEPLPDDVPAAEAVAALLT